MRLPAPTSWLRNALAASFDPAMAAALPVSDDGCRQAVLVGATYEPQEAMAKVYVDAVTAPERWLADALETARRLAEMPADTYRFTKDQLCRDAVARIARSRQHGDPRVAELSAARVADGHIRADMKSVVRRG